MESIWLGLCPSPRTTRILAMRGPGETILKAHLSLHPASHRAVVALLEAIALWEGAPVRCARCGRWVDAITIDELVPRHVRAVRRANAAVSAGVGAAVKSRAPPS